MWNDAIQTPAASALSYMYYVWVHIYNERHFRVPFCSTSQFKIFGVARLEKKVAQPCYAPYQTYGKKNPLLCTSNKNHFRFSCLLSLPSQIL